MAHRQGPIAGSGSATDRGDGDASIVRDERTPLTRRGYVRTGVLTVLALVTGASWTVQTASASDTGEGEPDQHILISGCDELSRYEITVDGSLLPGRDACRDADARISGGSAEGIVGDEERRYRFSGGIRDLIVDGDAAVTVEP